MFFRRKLCGLTRFYFLNAKLLLVNERIELSKSGEIFLVIERKTQKISAQIDKIINFLPPLDFGLGQGSIIIMSQCAGYPQGSCASAKAREDVVR
jgi:hypothetical protein